MRTYFISDLHFGHTNLLTFERTTFSTIEEHDNFLIEIINKTVKLTDTLYILGDVGSAEKVRKLNGRKILIMGNHDKRPVAEYLTMFNEVYEHPIYITKRIVLSHYPIPVTQGILNLHGHIHGAYLDSKNHINLSAMLIGYKPMSLDVVGGIVKELPKDNVSFLGEWYAEKYIFLRHEARTDVITNEIGLVDLEASLKLRKERK